jgi:hypothetical protein
MDGIRHIKPVTLKYIPLPQRRLSGLQSRLARNRIAHSYKNTMTTNEKITPISNKRNVPL